MNRDFKLTLLSKMSYGDAMVGAMQWSLITYGHIRTVIQQGVRLDDLPTRTGTTCRQTLFLPAPVALFRTVAEAWCEVGCLTSS